MNCKELIKDIKGINRNNRNNRNNSTVIIWGTQQVYRENIYSTHRISRGEEVSRVVVDV